MNPSCAIGAAVLLATTILACVSNEPSQVPDEPSQVRSEDIAKIGLLQSEPGIESNACFIEGFCGPPRFCIHRGPCTDEELARLAFAFCESHCTQSNCAFVVARPPCP